MAAKLRPGNRAATLCPGTSQPVQKPKHGPSSTTRPCANYLPSCNVKGEAISFCGGHIQRTASAHWSGGLKDGKGTVSTQSGVLSQTQYSFSTRFENGVGTNPEELIAAAHAGCFSMALSAQLDEMGMTADSIDTKATLTMEKTDAGFTITAVHLDVSVKVPGGDQAKFDQAAQNAEKGCPVSRVLNANITLDAKLLA